MCSKYGNRHIGKVGFRYARPDRGPDSLLRQIGDAGVFGQGRKFRDVLDHAQRAHGFAGKAARHVGQAVKYQQPVVCPHRFVQRHTARAWRDGLQGGFQGCRRASGIGPVPER